VHAEEPRFRVTEDEVNVWFKHRVEVADDDGAIAGGVVVGCALTSGPEPELDLVSCFADTNAFFLAYPYIRESVHTIARRLGLGGVVLGMVKREIPLPDFVPAPPTA